MQNDSNPQNTNAEIHNHGYVLTIETFEGEMHTHPLTLEESRNLNLFALSATLRKKLLKNFLNSIKNQPSEKFLHIQKWLESILANTKTEFFTVQIEKIDPEQKICLPIEITYFEKEYRKYAPEWALERNSDGSYKYHATDSAFKTWLPLYENIIKLKDHDNKKTLENHCMIGQMWFMKDTPVSALIKHAEEAYKSEVVAQNSKIKFGTDDNEVWWAHDVPYFGEVQMNWIKEDQEWDIHFNECWQGPFQTKSECIHHLEECIQEKRNELGQEG